VKLGIFQFPGHDNKTKKIYGQGENFFQDKDWLRKDCMMAVEIQTLKSLFLFKDMEPEELELISEIIHPMRVTEGETLTRRGDAAHSIFIIISGNFMVSFAEDRAFTLHKKGEIIGLSTVLSPFRYAGTAVALTDGEVLSVSGQEFNRLIQSNSTLGDKIIKKINKIVKDRMPFAKGQKDSIEPFIEHSNNGQPQ